MLIAKISLMLEEQISRGQFGESKPQTYTTTLKPGTSEEAEPHQVKARRAVRVMREDALLPEGQH
jgi:hypothetical protein